MGFDPSTIRRPEPKSETIAPSNSRDARVLSLAQELHRRGVTVSLADARRLAEGMVDVERKVISEGSRKPGEPRPIDDERVRAQSTDATFRAAGVAPPVTTAPTRTDGLSTVPALSLPADLAGFVDRVAGGAHTAPRPVAPVPAPSPIAAQSRVTSYEASAPSPKSAPIVYGRNDEFRNAAVPHVSARKQMFFDEAPPLTQLRGFQQAGKVPEGLKHYGFKGEQSVSRPAAAPAPVFEAQAPNWREPTPAPSASARPVPVPTSEPTSRPEPVSEKFDAEPDPEPAAEPEPVPEPIHFADPESAPTHREPSAPTFAYDEPVTVHAPAPEPAPQREEQARVPVPEPEKPKEDLAKQHGVDIFQMFKVKK